MSVSNSSDSGAGPRLIPYTKIVHQPSPIYRMRYKAENRKTFLCAENYNQSATLSNPATNTNSPNANEAKNSPNSKKAATSRKKHATTIINNETTDGAFPKIEVIE